MAWIDQAPEATNVLLSARITRKNGNSSVWFEIDKLDDGTYRATKGNLFASMEIIRSPDLERVLRAVEAQR